MEVFSLKYYVGVDIGATNLRVAITDEKMRILERLTEITSRKNVYSISRQIVRMIRSFRVFRSGVVGVEGIGIGAAGLVQVAVWVITIPRLLNLASSSIGGFLSTIQIPTNFLVLAVVYFILGYLLFAVISAGIGAISSSSREGQQLIGLFTVPACIPLWFMSLLMFFPDNPVWVVLTIFPLTAPVEVIVRMGVSDIPAWQLATSITVLGLSIIGGLLLITRIFRTYLLMYGKRPGIGEIIRNLRSA